MAKTTRIFVIRVIVLSDFFKWWTEEPLGNQQMMMLEYNFVIKYNTQLLAYKVYKH